jgi:hypothetical protein
MSVLSDNVLEGRTEDDILRIARYRTLVLSPEERPVVIVLKVVGLTEQQTWSHITWNEREVGTVITIEHLLRSGSTYDSYERVVMIGMTTVEPVGDTIDLILADDVRIIDMGIVDGDTEIQYSIDTCPVA